MLVKDANRALARIVTIDSFKPIEKADRIELAVIGGWEVIVGKGMYQPGDKALYLEIDATLPVDSPTLADFDKKRFKIIEDAGQSYVVIKSMRMKKELSQGLVINIANKPKLYTLAVGTDVSALLGVQKYVSPEEAKLYYQAELEAINITRNEKISWFRKVVWKICARLKKGIVTDGLLPFPTHLQRSEQPRAQNIGHTLLASYQSGQTYEFSVKLNGESISYFTEADTNVVGIAQRNYACRTEDVPYTRKEAVRVYLASLIHYVVRKCAGAQMTFPRYKTAFKATDTPSVELFLSSGIKERLEALNENLAGPKPVFTTLRNCKISVQGECVGPDFNGGAENAPENAFYAYNVYANGNRELSPPIARLVVNYLALKYVPVVYTHANLPPTIKELLALADGKGVFNPSQAREGIVGKCNEETISFKAISNKWLLKNDAEGEAA